MTTLINWAKFNKIIPFPKNFENFIETFSKCAKPTIKFSQENNFVLALKKLKDKLNNIILFSNLPKNCLKNSTQRAKFPLASHVIRSHLQVGA